jgi:hypothetical protein
MVTFLAILLYDGQTRNNNEVKISSSHTGADEDLSILESGTPVNW